jgi:membrane-bound lytic murein transglycosylase D
MKNKYAPLMLIASLVAGGCAYDGQPTSTASGNISATDDFRDQHPLEPGFEAAGYDDTWARVRARLALVPSPNPRVDTRVQSYQRYPDAFRRATRRAQPFLYHIAVETEARGFPGEVALLPIIESGFNPTAMSYKHAAGIWQIMPATGTRFGLTQDWWYEGRMDITESTRAALDYLQYLNRLFEGDWLLTLAAYNAGEGRVKRAMEKNRRAGKPTDFWHLALPRETRDYVPKLLAVAEIVNRPDYFGFRLEPVDNTPYLVAVDTSGQVDLTHVAEMTNLSVPELTRYNPAFRRWATPPDGPHQILVPSDRAETLRLGLADLPAEERVTWKRHRIARGETLSHIAKRYGVPIHVIVNANQIGNHHRIRAGKDLVVPTPRNPETAKALAQRSVPAKKNSGSNRVVYVVRPGDSLWAIARRFGVSHVKLAEWNRLALNEVLRPGKRLVLWT